MKFGTLVAQGLVATIILAAALTPQTSSAQMIDIGGQTCTQNYAWYDYYTNGQLTDSQYEPDGVTCFDNGSGGGNYGDPYSGGGGGGGGWFDSEGVWVSIPGGDYRAEVNMVKHQVRTPDLACKNTEAVQRQVVAGRILVKNMYLKPTVKVVVTFSDGFKADFYHTGGLSTVSGMVQASGCYQ
ncbi:hypothetical protein SAMN05428982_0629 [Pseudoxanthomonas sp. CF385]|nr:hypothetical protein SAMN05428982_0629 [Pseudoxanthomonas sp. CF385]